MKTEKEFSEVPNKIIQVNEEIVKEQLNEIVRETAEETLNKLLDAENLFSYAKRRNTNLRVSYLAVT